MLTTLGLDAGEQIWSLVSGNEGPQLRLQVFEDLDGKSAGELVGSCFRSGHEGDDGPVEPVANHEDEGRGSAHGFVANDVAIRREAFQTVVAGPGFATHGDNLAVWHRDPAM